MIYSQNFIGSTISFLLPYVTNAAWYFAQPMITSQIKNYIKKEVISKLVNRYFNKPIMEGISTFIWEIVAQNWERIYKLNPTNIAKFIMSEIFEGFKWLFKRKNNEDRMIKHSVIQRIDIEIKIIIKFPFNIFILYRTVPNTADNCYKTEKYKQKHSVI